LQPKNAADNDCYPGELAQTTTSAQDRKFGPG